MIMDKQVLSIEQMQHLIELGVDTSKASMAWCKPEGDKEYHLLLPNSQKSFEYDLVVKYIPTFTLQDMLDIMPKQLKIKVESYRTPVDCLLMIDVANTCVYYECFVWQQYDRAKYFDGVNLISSAYEMLCWLAENGYLNKK